MKLFMLIALATTGAFAATNVEVAAFIAPIAGEYQMTGKGCGLVKLELEEVNGYAVVSVDGELFQVSAAEDFKLKGRELSFSTEETDNAWPNLKDWKKEEAKIVKDQAGRLESVAIKSGWGKPFYRNKRWQTKCTLKGN